MAGSRDRPNRSGRMRHARSDSESPATPPAPKKPAALMCASCEGKPATFRRGLGEPARLCGGCARKEAPGTAVSAQTGRPLLHLAPAATTVCAACQQERPAGSLTATRGAPGTRLCCACKQWARNHTHHPAACTARCRAIAGMFADEHSYAQLRSPSQRVALEMPTPPRCLGR